MTPLRKYIWLIKLLQGSDGKTFESINKEWLKFRQNTEDENISIQKRTFHNHINAIREEYGIHIECGPGYKYYISDSEKDILPQIELLSALSMLSETVTESRLNKSLYVEDYFDLFRNNKVAVILDAIKTRRKVKFANFKNVNAPDKYQVLHVAPYQIHYIGDKWYVVGHTDEYGLMRIPLAYFRGVHISDDLYKYPSKYLAYEYRKKLYGPTNQRIQLTIEIKSHDSQELNLNDYPLIPFQENVEYRERLKDEKIIDYIINNYVKVSLDMPKSPFALYTLRSKLEKYRYNIINDVDPFKLFTEEIYNDAISNPTIL